MKPKSMQLALPIGVDESRSFDNFNAGSNARLLEHLKDQIQLRLNKANRSYSAVILWGDTSVGKTHLLSALVQLCGQLDGEVCWFNSGIVDYAQRIENNKSKIYLLDDIEDYVTDSTSEQALLSSIEQIKQVQGLLIMTATRSINHLGIELADLLSRFKAMDSFELIALDDAQKREVVRMRALQRGIVLSDEVINWLFNHTSRNLSSLLELLEQMDITSLAQKRKVTIPLIKAMLDE